MKTIPVSFILAGLLLPAACLAQPPEPPSNPQGEQKGNGPRPFVEMWKRADTNHDGFIAPAEFEIMPRIQKVDAAKRDKLFRRLDKNDDHLLSREELSRFGNRRDGQPGQPMKRLWELDSDKSGGISIEEFKAGQLFKKLPPEKQDAVFNRLDTDGDGVVTPKDRPEPPFNNPDGKSHSQYPDGRHQDGGVEEKPGQINRRLDTDADGALSFEEFRLGAAVKNLTEDEQEDRFELLDRNHDLKISPGDFPPPPSVDH